MLNLSGEEIGVGSGSTKVVASCSVKGTAEVRGNVADLNKTGHVTFRNRKRTKTGMFLVTSI